MSIGRKGSTGASTTLIRFKKDYTVTKKERKQRNSQSERMKKEAAEFDIVKLQNGDFKKVEKKAKTVMSKAEFEAYRQKRNGM